MALADDRHALAGRPASRLDARLQSVERRGEAARIEAHACAARPEAAAPQPAGEYAKGLVAGQEAGHEEHRPAPADMRVGAAEERIAHQCGQLEARPTLAPQAGEPEQSGSRAVG